MTLHIMPSAELLKQGFKVQQREPCQGHEEPWFVYTKDGLPWMEEAEARNLPNICAEPVKNEPQIRLTFLELAYVRNSVSEAAAREVNRYRESTSTPTRNLLDKIDAMMEREKGETL